MVKEELQVPLVDHSQDHLKEQLHLHKVHLMPSQHLMLIVLRLQYLLKHHHMLSTQYHHHMLPHQLVLHIQLALRMLQQQSQHLMLKVLLMLIVLHTQLQQLVHRMLQHQLVLHTL